MAKTGMPDSVRGVMGWTLGVGIIAFILLIMVIIFGNLSGNVGFSDVSNTSTNESSGYAINGTTYTLVAAGNSRFTGTTVNTVYNATDGVVVGSGNYTVDGTLGTIVGAAGRTANWTTVNITSTNTFTSQGDIDSSAIILNYTSSATNTAAQFPTVGTIIGIAILLAILIALLIFAIRRMMGVADSPSNSESGSFSGSERGFG